MLLNNKNYIFTIFLSILFLFIPSQIDCSLKQDSLTNTKINCGLDLRKDKFLQNLVKRFSTKSIKLINGKLIIYSDPSITKMTINAAVGTLCLFILINIIISGKPLSDGMDFFWGVLSATVGTVFMIKFFDRLKFFNKGVAALTMFNSGIKIESNNKINWQSIARVIGYHEEDFFKKYVADLSDEFGLLLGRIEVDRNYISIPADTLFEIIEYCIKKSKNNTKECKVDSTEPIIKKEPLTEDIDNTDIVEIVSPIKFWLADLKRDLII